ncbi:MAG: caspase family protein, partial [Xanthobacteraceae bacterium]|nr:caspase family protein [Xanthobacteraceae bacterium]
MKHHRNFAITFVSVLLLFGTAFTGARAAEKRIALVVGNANYSSGALPTPANDAGLIAQTLQAAGFDVVGVRDLDQDSLRRTFRDFIAKASTAGPDTVAFVYLSGYGLQLEGENYFVPTDANIARDANVSAEALRVSDYTKPLAALGIKASIVILDAARANPFAKSGPQLAGGLALVEPEAGTLIAFNAAPGTVAQSEAGPYSSYAQALAEMMREGGLPVADLFNRIRLRVNEITKGAQVPWNTSKLQAPFYFFQRAPDAPPPQVSPEQTSRIRSKPIRDFDAQDAYLAALDRDNLQDYENFLVAYPNDPMARRVRAIVAARREAITWRRSRNVNTPPAYWSYLRRYPNGFHANDARRRLAYLTAALEPPLRFEIITYDVPPPPPDEVIYVERPVLIFDDPDFGFEPPPPPPLFFLPPRPVYFIDLAPPPPPVYEYVLPVPAYAPVPAWINTPEYVAPPPSNVIYNNIHNTVVVNNTTNTVVITNPGGQSQTFSPPPQSPASQTQPPAASKSSPSNAGIAGAGIAGAGAAALLAPSLPPSVAPKAIPIQDKAPPNALPPGQMPPGVTPPINGKPPVVSQPSPAASPPTQPAPQGQAPKVTLPDVQAGQPLPGAPGQPLPPVNGKPPVAGQLLPAPSPPTQPAPQGQAPKTTLPDTKAGQPLPNAARQPQSPIDS